MLIHTEKRNKRIEKHMFFSVGLGEHTEKFISPRLKRIFLCSQPHRKKELNAQKNYFKTVATAY